MSEQSALQIATEFLDALTNKDFERVATHVAPDFSFDGPIAHYRSAEEFLTGAWAFVEQIQPG